MLWAFLFVLCYNHMLELRCLSTALKQRVWTLDGPMWSLGFVLMILVDPFQLMCHNWEEKKKEKKRIRKQNNKTQCKTFSLKRGSIILCHYSALAQSNLFSCTLMRHNFLYFTKLYQQLLISQPNNSNLFWLAQYCGAMTCLTVDCASRQNI